MLPLRVRADAVPARPSATVDDEDEPLLLTRCTQADSSATRASRIRLRHCHERAI